MKKQLQEKESAAINNNSPSSLSLSSSTSNSIDSIDTVEGLQIMSSDKEFLEIDDKAIELESPQRLLERQYSEEALYDDKPDHFLIEKGDAALVTIPFELLPFPSHPHLRVKKLFNFHYFDMESGETFRLSARDAKGDTHTLKGIMFAPSELHWTLQSPSNKNRLCHSFFALAKDTFGEEEDVCNLFRSSTLFSDQRDFSKRLFIKGRSFYRWLLTAWSCPSLKLWTFSRRSHDRKNYTEEFGSDEGSTTEENSSGGEDGAFYTHLHESDWEEEMPSNGRDEDKLYIGNSQAQKRRKKKLGRKKKRNNHRPTGKRRGTYDKSSFAGHLSAKKFKRSLIQYDELLIYLMNIHAIPAGALLSISFQSRNIYTAKAWMKGTSLIFFSKITPHGESSPCRGLSVCLGSTFQSEFSKYFAKWTAGRIPGMVKWVHLISVGKRRLFDIIKEHYPELIKYHKGWWSLMGEDECLENDTRVLKSTKEEVEMEAEAEAETEVEMEAEGEELKQERKDKDGDEKNEGGEEDEEDEQEEGITGKIKQDCFGNFNVFRLFPRRKSEKEHQPSNRICEENHTVKEITAEKEEPEVIVRDILTDDEDTDAADSPKKVEGSQCPSSSTKKPKKKYQRHVHSRKFDEGEVEDVLQRNEQYCVKVRPPKLYSGMDCNEAQKNKQQHIYMNRRSTDFPLPTSFSHRNQPNHCVEIEKNENRRAVAKTLCEDKDTNLGKTLPLYGNIEVETEYANELRVYKKKKSTETCTITGLPDNHAAIDSAGKLVDNDVYDAFTIGHKACHGKGAKDSNDDLDGMGWRAKYEKLQEENNMLRAQSFRLERLYLLKCAEVSLLQQSTGSSQCDE
eukprot:m.147363 g.147363  ORF g.147363 m.147363 type:complete len:847 (-) comp13241_c0_seq14:3894-6434(-)